MKLKNFIKANQKATLYIKIQKATVIQGAAEKPIVFQNVIGPSVFKLEKRSW